MTDTSPVELPTGRRSYIAPSVPEGITLQEKDWIPVLDQSTITRYGQLQDSTNLSLSISDSYFPFPKPSAGSGNNSPIPATSTATNANTIQKAGSYPPPPQKLVHNYSRSSLAPESVNTNAQSSAELETMAPTAATMDSLPKRTSSKKASIAAAAVLASHPSQQQQQHDSVERSAGDVLDNGLNTAYSDASAGSSMLEEQYVSVSVPEVPAVHPAHSTQSQSLSSPNGNANSNITKVSVFPPTSKYNRKHTSIIVSPISPSSVVTAAATVKSQNATPNASPKLQPVQALAPPPIPQQAELSSSSQQNGATVTTTADEATPPPTAKLSTRPSVSKRQSRNNLTSPASNLSLYTQFPAQQQQQQQQQQSQGRTGSLNSPCPSEDAAAAATSGGDNIRARPPSTRHKARKSTDSRTRSPIYDSTQPTPVPTTPLPQLPPSKPASRRLSPGRGQSEGRRTSPVGLSQSQPSSSHATSTAAVAAAAAAAVALSQVQSLPRNNSASAASISAQQQQQQQQQQPALHTGAAGTSPTAMTTARMTSPDTSPTNEHIELTEFMTRRSTLVFRRFDELHVKLLLHLQDEITQLEDELGQLEAAAGEKTGGPRMIRVVRELRKVVAEYDHLFTTWSQMQTHKISNQTMADLRQYLLGGKKPSSSASLNGAAGASAPASASAREDYKWLDEKRHDLSTWSFDDANANANANADKTARKNRRQSSHVSPQTKSTRLMGAEKLEEGEAEEEEEEEDPDQDRDQDQAERQAGRKVEGGRGGGGGWFFPCLGKRKK